MPRMIVIAGYLALSATLACGTSPTTRPDAAVGADGTTADSGSASDASLDGGVRPDAEPRADVGPVEDGSLAGTPLDGIEVRFDSPLELCNEWREGQSFEEELASKLHVTIAPAERRSLDRGDLSIATITSGTIRRGLEASVQWQIDDLSPSSELIEWRVQDIGGTPYLTAAIAHDLGPAGVLVERFGVSRSSGDRRPVDYEQDVGRGEVSFFIRAEGEPDERAVLLTPCEGSPELEDAIEVIAAQGASRSAVVIRSLRTALALAGSAPIHLESAQIALSDRPGEIFAARGPFALIYAAEHHNWNEHSRIDFTKDIVMRELVIEPFETGGQARLPWMIERADIEGIARFDMVAPTLRLVTRDLTTGQRATEELMIGSRNWSRVDAVELAREYQNVCAQPVVEAIGETYNRHLFQVVHCPGSGALGYTVVAVVPVAFPEAIGEVGRRIQGSAIRDADGKVAVTIGANSLELRPSPPGSVIFAVRDSNGQMIEEALSTPHLLDFSPAPDEVLFGESEDGRVSVRLVRRWGGQGAGSSSIFAPVSFELRIQGTVHEVEALDRLDYESTHHNWNDTFRAETDELTLSWHIELDRATVSARRKSDGTMVLPPTPVVMR
jgi:hypothetical protein